MIFDTSMLLQAKPKPIDTSKPYVKGIIEASPSSSPMTTGLGILSTQRQAQSVVVDPYSGKYFGEADKNVFTEYFTNTIKGIQNSIAYVTKYGKLENNTSTPGILSQFKGSIPLTDIQKAEQLAKLNEQLTSATSELDKFNSNYEQRPQMIASFNAHPEAWGKYMESSYKNPRQAESNASQINPQGGSTNPLSVLNPQKVNPKTVGTGMASTAPINPFGTLETGLGV